jgi:hypothetical protein
VLLSEAVLPHPARRPVASVATLISARSFFFIIILLVFPKEKSESYGEERIYPP